MGKPHRGAITHSWNRSDDNGCFQWSAHLPAFLPLDPEILDGRVHDAHTGCALDHATVIPYVPDSCLRVFAHPIRRGKVRRVVKAGSRYRNRKLFQAAVLLELIALMDLLLSRSGVHDPRFDGVSTGLSPSLGYLAQLAVHADRVDFPAGGMRAHQDRNAIFLSFRIHHVFK